MAEKKKHGCLSVIGGLAIVFVLIGIITSSGNNKKSDDSKNDGKVNTTQTERSDNGHTNKDKASTDETLKENVNEVVFDNGEVKITYTGYEAEALFKSATLNFLIENNSRKNIRVSNFSLNINGYTVDTWFYEEVPAGKKSNASMSLYTTELENNGIDTLGVVELSFQGKDADEYDELFTTDPIEIVFDESAVQEENLDNYQLVFEGSDVSVYYKGIEDGGFITDSKFKFLVVNNSDKTVTISADNMSVNDFAMTDLFHAECAPNKKTNEYISVYKSDLEKNNITKIEKFEFSLKCRNENYDTLWETDPITIDIK